MGRKPLFIYFCHVILEKIISSAEIWMDGQGINKALRDDPQGTMNHIKFHRIKVTALHRAITLVWMKPYVGIEWTSVGQSFYLPL